MYTGEYNHTIDAKGRMTFPAKIRESLGEGFVITKGLDGCLFVFDKEGWKELTEKLAALPLTDKGARQFTRFFLAGAADAEVDKQGRILLPMNLRSFAGIEKDVVLIGVGNRAEIWSKERYEGAVDYEDMDEFAQSLTTYGLI
ncbi:MAG: division/cell wall cluster transcriptional repressor MraZ [Lachnospiraceae bacterium]|nr:division/cell wall cluster transcriptional repressor MraZ [Candidatus Merdinaster equi]